MSVDEKIRILLRAAARAEGVGDDRVARIFRRRAEEARPMDMGDLPAEVWQLYGLVS
jgi:hypothetical protein